MAITVMQTVLGQHVKQAIFYLITKNAERTAALVQHGVRKITAANAIVVSFG
jgi:hypothetical protein